MKNTTTAEQINQVIGQYVSINSKNSMYQYLKPFDIKNGIIRVRIIPKPVTFQNISTIINYD